MKSFLNKKTVITGAAAFALIAGLSVPSTMAYFTTNVAAEGSQAIQIGADSTIHEDVSEMTKHITIENTGDNECFVRTKAFAGSAYTLTYTTEDSNWTSGQDGYWYYNVPVQPGESTGILNVKIDVPVKDGNQVTDDFDVVVVQEYTQVTYDEAGNPVADWSKEADITSGISNREEAGN